MNNACGHAKQGNTGAGLALRLSLAGCLLICACNKGAAQSGDNVADLQAPRHTWPTFQAAPTRQGVILDGGSRPPYQTVWTYTPDRNTNGFVDWGPVVAEGKLFTPDGTNHILAFAAETGKLLWERGLSSNTFGVTWVQEPRMLLATTAITTRPSPTFYALDPDSGRLMWDNMHKDQPAIGGIEGPPVVIGDRIFVAYLTYEGAGGVCAYTLQGQLQWRRLFPELTPLSPLSTDGKRLFVGVNDRKYYALDVATGEILWSQGPFGALPTAAPTVTDEGVVVGVHNRVLAFEPSTGEIKWDIEVEGDIGTASPAYHAGIVFVLTRSSHVYAVDAANGVVKWQTAAGAASLDSSPVIDAQTGLLYFGSHDNAVLILDAATGETVQRIQLGPAQYGNWRNSPAVLDGWIFIGSSDKTLYALHAAANATSH